ncbi:MAG: segregation/condensation protein A [Candidatus Dadabacteria bacterium]|nr:segregation/condensation protein A [Candidatus Dadabacteria bacterium]MCY4263096.1 segregation/condensation protein A [Candidatus Dadabacteria bacterium]
MEDPQSEYSVQLEIFSGPLDLLLHLIKKHEVDIYDIPIARITKQYLEYLNFLKDVNLEIAGDYMSMAAELGYIKSRMLLPKIKEEGEEEEQDPREELVKRLLEYEKYRNAAAELAEMEILGKDVFPIGYDPREMFGEPIEETEFVKFDLWSLVDTFSEIYKSRKRSQTKEISLPSQTYTVEERKKQLVKTMRRKREVLFEDLFEEDKHRSKLVVTFLSVLELLKEGILEVFQPSFKEPIRIILREQNER